MPRKCTVCEHPERTEIEKALVGADSFRVIAKRHGVSTGALGRHKESHLPAKLLKAQKLREQAEAGDLFASLQEIQMETREVLEIMRGKNHVMVLKAIARMEKQLELQAKLLGHLKDETTINVHLSPEWVQLRTAILRALEPYPEARFALAHVLSGSGHDVRN